jgi:hypothetical protein
MTIMSDMWTTKNPVTRKYEAVDICLDELPPGTRIIRAYRTDDKYVTIPGASLYVVNERGQIVSAE